MIKLLKIILSFLKVLDEVILQGVVVVPLPPVHLQAGDHGVQLGQLHVHLVNVRSCRLALEDPNLSDSRWKVRELS